ncbi:MAG: holo-ACP synthase [Opitutales bacterium]|nr:holo-ACP synthase [Opitutales bacterium]MCH8540787.1 holo-ACP synthase [Opitutales bacterium]
MTGGEKWPPVGGWILGLGNDLVEVSRVEKAIQRHGEKFLQRVFTPEEIRYAGGMKSSGKHFAARFAAKEAVSKAFRTGIGKELNWTSVGVIHGSQGEPLVVLDALGKQLLQRLGGDEVWVSLSHTETLAQATALLLTKSPRPL